MRPSSPVIEAFQAARLLGPSMFGHTSLWAIRRIVDALARVPDYQPDAFSDQDLERLQSVAESTIVAIEHRLDSRHDRSSVRVELAQAVYTIRRRLEEITHWRRHYRGAVPPHVRG